MSGQAAYRKQVQAALDSLADELNGGADEPDDSLTTEIRDAAGAANPPGLLRVKASGLRRTAARLERLADRLPARPTVSTTDQEQSRG